MNPTATEQYLEGIIKVLRRRLKFWRTATLWACIVAVWAVAWVARLAGFI